MLDSCDYKFNHKYESGSGFKLSVEIVVVFEAAKPKVWGFFGENPQKIPNFGDGDGVTTLRIFGDTLGTGKPQTLGFFWGKIPENPQISGWGRGKEYRGFSPH